ncbi:50S ribosomal protein L25 [candidate division WWE3 bacterium]|nr:50S ribosomal protein L25 [candidate division WWE3 bacterium]
MEIIAEKRTALGKQNKKLRKDRKVPGVIYGKGMESVNVMVGLLDLVKTFKGSGESTLVDVLFDGKKEKVLVTEVQVHPVTGNPIHASFHKVNLKEKIKANVPVVAINEELNAFVKSGEGMILSLINEIEVEALPANLPHNFEVDVKDLKLNEGITVGQLNFDRTKVEIVDLEDDELVVKLDSAKMAEEVEEVVASEEELVAGVEATKEKKEEDSEESKDGENKVSDNKSGKDKSEKK